MGGGVRDAQALTVARALVTAPGRGTSGGLLETGPPPGQNQVGQDARDGHDVPGREGGPVAAGYSPRRVASICHHNVSESFRDRGPVGVLGHDAPSSGSVVSKFCRWVTGTGNPGLF